MPGGTSANVPVPVPFVVAIVTGDSPGAVKVKVPSPPAAVLSIRIDPS